MALVLGCALALCGGATLALAMVTQRYALDPLAGGGDANKVPVFGYLLSRHLVWFSGLVLYGGANGFYAMALLYGPLSLLAGVFTTLLIFNLFFARILLGEVLTFYKILGAIFILCGVIMCIIATPRSGTETEFEPKDIESLIKRPAGFLYITILFSVIICSIRSIIWFEKKYPLSLSKTGSSNKKENESTKDGMSSSLTSTNQEDEDEEGAQGQDSNEEVESPPLWLDRIMAVVYPGSLGVDEGIAHLTMKASVSMLDTCGRDNQCHRPTMYLFIFVWICASVATLWWLRTVFTRYETTRALPVEYGAVNAVSACSGLIFYKEYQNMVSWQLCLISLGVVVILSGIGIGNLSPPSIAASASSAVTQNNTDDANQERPLKELELRSIQ